MKLNVFALQSTCMAVCLCVIHLRQSLMHKNFLLIQQCSTYGCLLELTIQLSVVMLGKQFLNNCVELGVP